MRIVFLALVLSIFISGCSVVAVQYQPDFQLVNELNDSGIEGVNLGDFSESDESLNKVTLRASPMISPYEGSYGLYLKNALKEQLFQSKLFDQGAPIKISGVLLKNYFNASGVNVGKANLAARFIAMRGDREVYNEIHEISHEWESSFMGSIAIPNAQNNYPVAVQKLIRDFLADPDFITAVLAN